jgi:hypothetical protein
MYSQLFDLTGYPVTKPHYLNIRSRINALLDRYMSLDILSERLTDLPCQFIQPQQRPWEKIDWSAINRDQIIGISPDLFITVLAGIVEIEAPIREYAQESWSYFRPIHPAMAYFTGGEFALDGTLKTTGIWGKEERQHAPAFSKIYQQLTGSKLQPKPNSVIGFQPSGDPWADLHAHIHSRITTEWSAAAVYLWLMAHSTGALQQAIAQPFQDEINHLAKFWGFSRWAFGDSYTQQLLGSTQQLVSLVRHHNSERTHGKTLTGSTLRPSRLVLTVELTFTFMRVMVRMRSWNRELSTSYLRLLFGPLPQMTRKTLTRKMLAAA